MGEFVCPPRRLLSYKIQNAFYIRNFFSHVCSKESADFYVKCGFPAEMAEKMIGMKLSMKTVEFAEGKLACQMCFEGHPELGSCFLAYEGVANNLNLPHMGGKCVCTFKKTAKGVHNVIESETMGRWEMDEEYTDEGIKTVINKDGNVHTEFYKREICVDGLYKVSKLNGMKEYMKKNGYPEGIIAAMDEYKMAIKACDTGLKVWESWGEISNTFTCQFDVEQDYKMPFEGLPAAKVVVSQTGLGKYSWVLKAADGSAEEWKLCCCGETLTVCGRNLKNGDTASAELYKEHLPIMGSWKLASQSGIKDCLVMLGVPDAQACEMANEQFELCVEEKGPLFRWNYKSKFMPMDFTFKLAEETSIFDPVLKENVKAVATKNGNTMDIITVSSQGTWHTKVTAGHTFLVMKSCLKGLECKPMTYIFTRNC